MSVICTLCERAAGSRDGNHDVADGGGVGKTRGDGLVRSGRDRKRGRRGHRYSRGNSLQRYVDRTGEAGLALYADGHGVVAVPTCAETEAGYRASEKSRSGGEEGEEPPQPVVMQNNSERASKAALSAPLGPATTAALTVEEQTAAATAPEPHGASVLVGDHYGNTSTWPTMPKLLCNTHL